MYLFSQKLALKLHAIYLIAGNGTCISSNIPTMDENKYKYIIYELYELVSEQMTNILYIC